MEPGQLGKGITVPFLVLSLVLFDRSVALWDAVTWKKAGVNPCTAKGRERPPVSLRAPVGTGSTVLVVPALLRYVFLNIRAYVLAHARPALPYDTNCKTWGSALFSLLIFMITTRTTTNYSQTELGGS